MKRILTIAKLKPDKVARYIELHNTIGRDVIEAAHAHNLRNYSIHRVGVYLFSCFEYVGADYEADMAAKNALPVIRQWQRQTGECFDTLKSGMRSLTAEEIFFNEF